MNPVQLVASVYESLRARDIEKLQAIVTDDVTWNVTEGFPYAGIYTGLHDVLGRFYGRLRSNLDSFSAQPERWIDGGQHVVVLGYYLVTPKNEDRQYRVRFAHTWRIANDRISGVWQVADTATLPALTWPE